MSDSVMCLICGSKMRLEGYAETSYYQCEANLTHRMNLVEFSRLVRKERTEEAIKQTIVNRASALERQLDDLEPEGRALIEHEFSLRRQQYAAPLN